MKAASGWNENGNGINESGFTALPVGWRLIFGGFSDLGTNGTWWSSSEMDEENA